MTLCITCGNEFIYDKNFIKHIKQGNCKEKYIFIITKSYVQNPKLIHEMFIDKFNELKENYDGPKYGCDLCGKIYNSLSYLYQHRRIVCKPKQILQLVEDNNQQLQPQSIDNPQMLNQQSHVSTDSIVSSNNPNQSHNSNTNSNNNIGRDMNVVNNIMIKNYHDDHDNEILNAIPDDIKRKLLTSPQTAVIDLYKLIHVDMPEHRNVLIKHPKDGYGMIMKNGDWAPAPMKTLLTDLVVKNSDMLYDISQDETIHVKKSYMTKLTLLLEQIADNGKITADLRRGIKSISCEFRDLIEETYRTSQNKKQKLLMKHKLMN